ncbi:MAG: hypothetical protein ACE5WD_02305 [Candidatus Aminicenantia bacterium]
MTDKKTLEITPKDLVFIISLLKKEKTPLPLGDLALKLAYHKTAPQRSQPIKIYNPFCDYEPGDLIYKYYDELLNTSSRGTEHFIGGVALKVINKTFFKNFNCQMLEVDYEGGGLFRKYIDYMKKTKTQVLIPCNMEGKSEPIKFLDKKDDPRKEELPMRKNEFALLETKLKASLSKSDKFFGWNNYWYLTEEKETLDEKKISQIEEFLAKNKSSMRTKELVEKYFSTPESENNFYSLCLSLNHLFENKYKKKFILVSPDDWGKWNLKENLESLKENLPLSALPVKMPDIEINRKEIQEKFKNIGIQKEKSFPYKFHLTWREVLSGGIRILQELQKYFSNYREFLFIDKEDDKEYLVYYYPSSGYLLGLKELFEKNSVIQGTSLIVEHEERNRFSFSIKKAKKKFSFTKKVYNWKEDKILSTNQEMVSFCAVNKIIYLEEGVFKKLDELYAQRDELNLLELLHLIFKSFGLEEEQYKLHYSRAYHLVELLRVTTLEEVETVLLSLPEFFPSEKEIGMFHLDLNKIVKEEEIVEEKIEEEGELIEERKIAGKEMRVVEEIPELEKREKVPPLVEVKTPPKEEVTPTLEPLKKKPKKPKEVKREKDIPRKMKKGIKKRIEEKIVWEESEEEVISILHKKREEVPIEEKKEEEVPGVTFQEKAKFGLFAQKLQQALKKEKEQEKKEKK